MSNKATPTTTTDDGVRPARFGLKTVVAAVVLAALTTVFAMKIFGGSKDAPPSSTEPAPGPVAATPPVEPRPTPPAPPSIHPLEGRAHILSAPPSNWRHAYLSWSTGMMEVDYPIASVEMDDPCLWELVGVEDRRDVYRILNRTGSKWDGANLTYTHFDKQDHPYATVEKNDPGLWKVTPLASDPTRFKIACYDDSDWHAGELSWDSTDSEPIATVEKNDPTSWRILPEGEPLPKPATPVTHVIIFPKSDIAEEPLENLQKWAPEIIEHLAEDGNATLTLQIDLDDGNELEVSYGGTTFQSAAEQLRAARDPVAALLPGSLSAGRNAIAALVTDAAGDDRKLEPFPLVLPVTGSGTLRIESIRTLLFEDKGFFRNKLEKVTHFQTRLDESDAAAGRVFHGAEYFTYVFVNLTP